MFLQKLDSKPYLTFDKAKVSKYLLQHVVTPFNQHLCHFVSSRVLPFFYKWQLAHCKPKHE